MYFTYADTATRGALVIMGLTTAACDMAARAAAPSASEQKHAAPQTASEASAPETRKKAPVTPAIIAASQQLLATKADAPIGQEFPIVVEGKAYLARIEEHDNATGSASRPPGKHKGVTVYER